MSTSTPRVGPARPLAERIGASRKHVIMIYGIMQSILQGKDLTGLAAGHYISTTVAVRRIAIFGSRVVQFLDDKISTKNPNYKAEFTKKTAATSILSDTQVRKVSNILRDILDHKAKWSIAQILECYRLEAETLHSSISVFGLRLLKDLEKCDTIDRDLAYLEIVFDPMAKCFNGMGAAKLSRCAEEEQEDAQKERLENPLTVHHVYPPTKWLVRDGKSW